jgi:Tfp pilus assembly protein PilW
MYLAGILGLCALLHVPAWGLVRSGHSSFAPTSEAGISRQNQEPTKPDQPAPPTPQQDQPKPDTSQTAPPSENAQQPEAAPNSGAPNAAPNNESGQPNQKSAAVPKKRPVKKKHTSPATGQEAQKKEAQKKVVHRGGTGEPTTQLAPGMTDEQAARQRQNTNQLLASTDASLQQLSGRQLTKDEQDTVTQIRKFMEQVKAADAAGDLPRAYKLAVKAHLLSDALVKP